MSPGKELRLTSAKDAVAEELRKLIHTGEVQPGERLSIESVAERFGLSRTPVRDALFVLRSEGLVTIVPRIGVFVRNIDNKEAFEMYRIKGELEAIMAAWAAERGTAAQKRSIVRSLDSLREAAHAKDVTRYVKLLESRRQRLVEMAGSGVLNEVMQVIDGRGRLLRFGNMSDPNALLGSLPEHERIARAISDGDADAAYDAMSAHMRSAADRFQQIVEDRRAEEVADADSGE